MPSDNIETTGLPVWLVALVAGAIFVATALPKIFGPVSKAISDWTASRRRSAVEADDADISERDRQIAYLAKELAARRSEINRRDHALHEHARWDQQAQRALVQTPTEIGPPPPLWPMDDLPPEP